MRSRTVSLAPLSLPLLEHLVALFMHGVAPHPATCHLCEQLELWARQGRVPSPLVLLPHGRG